MSLYINNKWIDGSGDAMQSINPATGEVLWEGAMASPGELSEAIAAGREAHYDWSKKTLDERLVYLQKFTDLLTERKAEFAKLISDETG
ncbi:MAG: aldehyde dehydrogenase family protein, partial [Lentisphaeria bacterium]|nr:aldehyde dehydrogenase family protein [Lentisphaeria bacterium]NQZ70377.1 aldehyde dehydrogenase family protein [Lentisphaeria bacterium]